MDQLNITKRLSNNKTSGSLLVVMKKIIAYFANLREMREPSAAVATAT